MRTVIATALLLLVLAFVAPFLWLIQPETGVEEMPLTSDVLPSAVPTLPPTPQPGRDAQATVAVSIQGETMALPLADYLWGVVAAEMPASFELEALKAQAVTARTYAAYKGQHVQKNHPDAQVCDDVTCCQAYLSPAAAQTNWGADAQTYTEKIAQAVAETDGELILYEGQPIQAVFFSSADGMTQDAVAVWGNSLPYLTPVDSPEGGEVPNYRSQVTVSQEDFQKILRTRYPAADFSGQPETWVVDNTMGGVETNPTVVRSLFDLRSASFSLEAKGADMVFTVTGYGHGVGMSQYGANALAQEGATYMEILEHYYTGVEVG